MKAERRSIKWCLPLRAIVKTLPVAAMLLALVPLPAGLPPKSALAAEENAYYVSPSGSDSNPGTLSAPWRTIQKAADALSAGETAFIRGGTYKEYIRVNKSGSETAGFISLRNYPGEKPVIDGTELEVTDENEALVELSNVSYLRLVGFEIRGLASSSASYDPAGIRVKDGASHIELLNNDIHHIRNASSRGNAHGIHVLGNTAAPMTGIVISGNEVHSLKTGLSESLTLSGNIDGFRVTRNVVHDNNNIGIELAGFYGACSGGCTDRTRNGVVAENTVYRIDSSANPAYGSGKHAAGGIYADGAMNVVIERNHLYSNDFGIELASEKKGRATSGIVVRNNFIRHNYGAGLIMGGSDSSNGGASRNTIVHNTFLENDTLKQGYGDITLQWHNVDNTIANNIVFSNAQKIHLIKENGSGSGNKLDYNLYYNASGVIAARWIWNGIEYGSWSAYKKASGNDAHSLFGNPQFASQSADNIRLKPGSPAIDKGTSAYALSGACDWYGSARRSGKAVDIGAAEYASSAKPGIVIDGDASDWAGVAALGAGPASSHAGKLKAKTEGTELKLLVQGTALTEKGQFFLDTDNRSGTGFAAPYWKTGGADGLLENGVLYRYGGKGTDWSWKRAKSYRGTERFAATDTAIEVSVPLADLGLGAGRSFRIGFVWKDSASDKLPAGAEEMKLVKGAPQRPAEARRHRRIARLLR